MIWGSLLGLGVSAAAYGLSRNRKRNMLSPLSLMNNFGIGQSSQKPKMAGTTEFSNELVPNKNPFTNK